MKIFLGNVFCGDCLKKFCEDLFFFGEHLRLCPWSLVLASSIPVLGLESVCPRKGCPWPWPRIFFVSLALASSLVSSTPPLLCFIFSPTGVPKPRGGWGNISPQFDCFSPNNLSIVFTCIPPII